MYAELQSFILKHEIDKKTVKLKLLFTIDMHEIIDGFVRGQIF